MATATRTRKPKAPVVSTEVETVEPVIEGTVFEGELPTPEPEAEPVAESAEDRIAALKALWAKGTEDEESAWMSLSVARVFKARVAYIAGMIGSKTGEPNNKAAMRVLDLPQNTVRPYFLAGVALAKAGFEMSTNAPTQSEMDIADPIISKAQGGRKRAKAEGNGTDAPKGTGTGEGTGEGEGEGVGNPTPKDPENVILADVVAAVQELEKLVNVFTRSQGFAAVAADGIGEVLATIAATIEAHRVDGGDV